MERCLTSVKRSEHPSKHESAGIGPTPFGAQKFAMAEFHLNRCDGRRGSGFGQSAVRLVHTITGDDRHNRTRGQYTAEKNLKKKFRPMVDSVLYKTTPGRCIREFFKAERYGHFFDKK